MVVRTVKEVSNVASISVRTLHYYDEIGLLVPSEFTDKGYRLYTEADLMKLQQILFFKEIGFELKQIKEIMERSDFDTQYALEKQKKVLELKKDRLEKMIKIINDNLKGEKNTNLEVFDMSEIKKAQAQYEEEVKARWGETDAYKESARRTKQYTEADWKDIQETMGDIFKKLSEYRGQDVSNQEVQNLVAQWQTFISQKFYHCTDEILRGLGQMYVVDERFMKNIDLHGEGTAQFISDAIAYYCENK